MARMSRVATVVPAWAGLMTGGAAFAAPRPSPLELRIVVVECPAEQMERP